MYKVNNKDTSVFIVNFEHISHLVLLVSAGIDLRHNKRAH